MKGGDGRYIQAGNIRNILEDHGLKPLHVSGAEKIILVLHDRVHGVVHRLLPLPDGVNKPLGGVNLLLDEDLDTLPQVGILFHLKRHEAF